MPNKLGTRSIVVSKQQQQHQQHRHSDRQQHTNNNFGYKLKIGQIDSYKYLNRCTNCICITNSQNCVGKCKWQASCLEKIKKGLRAKEPTCIQKDWDLVPHVCLAKKHLQFAILISIRKVFFFSSSKSWKLVFKTDYKRWAASPFWNSSR